MYKSLALRLSVLFPRKKFVKKCDIRTHGQTDRQTIPFRRCFSHQKLHHITNILAKEKNKNIYIAGDFNFDLLKYSNHSETANFFDKMTSNLLVPLILIPTKINTKNDTLIENIFTNQFNSQTITGNLTVNFSDGHLPSFAIFPKHNQNHLPKKRNIYVRGKLEGANKDNFMVDRYD